MAFKSGDTVSIVNLEDNNIETIFSTYYPVAFSPQDDSLLLYNTDYNSLSDAAQIYDLTSKSISDFSLKFHYHPIWSDKGLFGTMKINTHTASYLRFSELITGETLGNLLNPRLSPYITKNGSVVICIIKTDNSTARQPYALVAFDLIGKSTQTIAEMSFDQVPSTWSAEKFPFELAVSPDETKVAIRYCDEIRLVTFE